MKFGFVLPFGDARFAAICARQAEKAGWDGFFVWEPIWGTDAWICLTAAAMKTKRIRLGTMLSPLPVLSPWKLASEAATLDNLSGGRVILSVGLGAVDTGFMNFGLPTDRKIRAERLDEGLEIITGLWKGQPFQFEGKHYHVKPTDFNLPQSPIQQPRIPIWVVGAWPKTKSMQRALQFDGLLPNFMGADGNVKIGHPDLATIREMVGYVKNNQSASHPYDIIMEGETNPKNAESMKIVKTFAEIGITWWIEAQWSVQSEKVILERLKAGPPR
jgi:hypothetical protein